MSRTAEQIAADRARYEEHQRKGLQAAPRALPEPSTLPPAPIADPVETAEVPGGWYWWCRLAKGEGIRITRQEGAGSVALVAWNALDPSERLNLPDTVKVQWNTKVQKGRVLFSDMGRVMLSVTEDSTGGAHDVLTGGSTAASNAARYPGVTRNTRDNLVLVAGKLGKVEVAVAVVERAHSRRDSPSIGSRGAGGGSLRFQFASTRVASAVMISSMKGIGSGSSQLSTISASVTLNRVGKRRRLAKPTTGAVSGWGMGAILVLAPR